MAQVVYSEVLKKVILGRSLTREEAHRAFEQIMDGAWTEAQIGGFLVALAAKGETPEEIAGGALAMREHVIPVSTEGAEVLDTCGTGGTGISTFNISTAVAMVLAGAGVRIAKHGNRTSTRASGSANVLEALGVNLDAGPDVQAACLREAGVCFCFAVKHHPAMRFAVPVRKQLAVRTVFNLLGPLTNPAGARRQMMGVFDASLTETLAEVLGMLGAIRAMVVHADDGLDEISITSETKVSEFRAGKVETYRIRPGDFGLPSARLEDLLVNSAEQSAQVIRDVLDEKQGPARDIVLLNAAGALVVADRADDLAGGMELASESIGSGAARGALQKLVEMSNAG
ncbi:MAG: anthranilate phosphoribosyltransferase [Phycisphaerae bacterium]